MKVEKIATEITYKLELTMTEYVDLYYALGDAMEDQGWSTARRERFSTLHRALVDNE